MSKTGYISARAHSLAQAVAPTLPGREEWMRGAGINVCDLGRGEPEFDTPPHVVEAVLAAIRAHETHYGPPEGLFQLREAIAVKLERDNHLTADPQTEIVVTNGTMEGIFIAILSLVNPGDEVLVLEPFFRHYEGFVSFAGGNTVEVPCLGADGRMHPTRDGIEERITPKCKALLLNSPHNPTGSVLSREAVEMLVELAVRHDFIIVTDDVYEAITFDEHRHTCVASISPEAKERTIVVNSLSKTYAMTGWRLGYAVAPRDLLRPMRNIHEKCCRMATSFVQRAGIAALLGPQDCVRDMVRIYQRRRDWVVGELHGLPGVMCDVPDGTFYVFPDISGLGMTSQEFAEYLLEEKHVLSLPGSYYGASGEGRIRLSFATDDTTLKTGLGVIQNAAVEIAATPPRARGR